MKCAAAAFAALLTLFTQPMGKAALMPGSRATVALTPALQSTTASDNSHARRTWNLARDIGITGNQIGFDQGAQGVWYFMVSSTTDHDPKLYRFIREFNAPALAFGGGITIPKGFSCWQEPGDVLPDVCFNFSGDPVTLENFDVPPHTLDMHPTAERLAIVAWKSPVQGVVRVQGSFVDLDPNCGNGIRWSIDRGEQTLRSDDLPNASAQSFSLAGVQVLKDDVLYFIVDADGDYACDSTALNLTISQAGRHHSW